MHKKSPDGKLPWLILGLNLGSYPCEATAITTEPPRHANMGLRDLHMFYLHFYTGALCAFLSAGVFRFMEMRPCKKCCCVKFMCYQYSGSNTIISLKERKNELSSNLWCSKKYTRTNCLTEGRCWSGSPGAGSRMRPPPRHHTALWTPPWAIREPGARAALRTSSQAHYRTK